MSEARAAENFVKALAKLREFAAREKLLTASFF